MAEPPPKTMENLCKSAKCSLSSGEDIFDIFLPRPSMKAYACTTRAGCELIQVIANHLTSNFGDPTLSSDVKTWNRDGIDFFYKTMAKSSDSNHWQHLSICTYEACFRCFPQMFGSFHEKRISSRSLSETTLTTFQWPTISIGCLRLARTPGNPFPNKMMLAQKTTASFPE